MPIQTYTARTAQHILLKGRFQYVTFELSEPNTLDFQAGQFIMMNVPGMPAKRSYSIASNPAENHKVEILVDVGPQGDGSMYLQSLNPGEEVTFMAPAGQFVLSQDPTEEKLLFVATGSGISALRSMILHLLHTQNDTRPINLHWGMRYVQDIFWEEEFRLLEKQFPNFHFDLAISQAPKVGHCV
jgi:phenol/toluene 2-monooxygenase (NADH) P5/A5